MVKGNETLHELTLWCMGVSSFAELADGLMTNVSLVSLDLGYNQLSDSSIPDVCRAIEDNSTLTNLSIRENLFTESCVSLLESSLELNTSIVKGLNLYPLASSPRTFPQFLWNQNRFISAAKTALQKLLMRVGYVGNQHHELMDLKQFFSLIWSFYDFSK
jgi:hypothetical protein